MSPYDAMVSAAVRHDIMRLYRRRVEGALFSAAALHLNFENTARTIPAVMNGVVGAQVDLSHRYVRTQPTTGNKPILRGSPAGATLIANGTFADASAWTANAGWVIGSGVATATLADTALGQAPSSLIAGHVYRINHTMTRTAGTLQPRFTGGTTVNGPARSAAGTFEDHLIAAAGNTTLEFLGAGFTGTADNVSIFDVSAGQVVAPYWLEGDGTKWMSFTMASALTNELKIAGARFNVDGALQIVSATFLSNDTSGQSSLRRTTGNAVEYFYRDTGVNRSCMAGALGVNTDCVMDGRWSPSSGIAGLNGVDGTPTAGTKIGNSKAVVMMSGLGGQAPINGRSYCDAIYGAAVSAGELALFREWASSQLEVPPL